MDWKRETVFFFFTRRDGINPSGYARLPRGRLNWDPSHDVRNVAVIRSMTRIRFVELVASIHVADNNSFPPGDKITKVYPLFTAVNIRFVILLPLQRSLAIDESMVPW